MTKKALAATALTSLLLMAEAAQSTYATERGIAIDGYDPVAYFTTGKATKGDSAHAFAWNGAKWLFASSAHQDQFAKDPAKFAPQYGGFCAYGMSRGYKAVIDPQAFTIIDGKLYLNYDAKVQDTWRKHTAGYIRQADAAWPRVKATAKIYR